MKLLWLPPLTFTFEKFYWVLMVPQAGTDHLTHGVWGIPDLNYSSYHDQEPILEETGETDQRNQAVPKSVWL